MKYNFSGIIGHEKQLEFLRGLIDGGRMPSGLLFYGQKNIGKRLTATAFAASVICADYKSHLHSGSGSGSDSSLGSGITNASLNFCGKCPSCMGILNGTSQNLISIDPFGSSIKIENIHKIDSFLSLTPAYPGYRFVIIGEASFMTVGAANALLKMLEEPPEKTVFILTTSNLSMILPTVISRCLLLGFSPINDEVLFNVFKAEYPDIEDGVLRLYSNLARGSYSGFSKLIEGKYLEKRNFLMNNVFKELFEEYRIIINNNSINDSHSINPYNISDKFNIIEKSGTKKVSKAPKVSKGSENDITEENEDKTAVFELILFILRDIYIYYVSKNEKLLYNEDIAEEIKRLANDSGVTLQGLANMIESTVEHIEKISSYNLNKSIIVDSYFYKLLSA